MENKCALLGPRLIDRRVGSIFPQILIMLELVPGHMFDLICHLLSHRTRGALLCTSRTLRLLVSPYSYFRPTLMEEASIEKIVSDICRNESLNYTAPFVIEVGSGSLEVVAIAVAAHLSRCGVTYTVHFGNTHWFTVETVRARLKQYLHKVKPKDWHLIYSNTSEHLRYDSYANTRIVFEVIATSYILQERDPLGEAYINDPQFDHTVFEVTVEKDEAGGDDSIGQHLLPPNSSEDRWVLVNTKGEPTRNHQINLVCNGLLHLRRPFDGILIRDCRGSAMTVVYNVLRYFPRHPKGKMKIHILTTHSYQVLRKLAYWGQESPVVRGGHAASVPLNDFLMRDGQYGCHLQRQLESTGSITFTYVHGKLREPIASDCPERRATDANGGAITNITIWKDHCIYLRNKHGQQARLLIKRAEFSWVLICNYNGHYTCNRIPDHLGQAPEMMEFEFRYRFFALTGNHWVDFPDKFVPIDGMYKPIERKEKRRDDSPKRKRRNRHRPKLK